MLTVSGLTEKNRRAQIEGSCPITFKQILEGSTMADTPIFDKMLFGAEADAECQDQECLLFLECKALLRGRRKKNRKSDQRDCGRVDGRRPAGLHDSN